MVNPTPHYFPVSPQRGPWDSPTLNPGENTVYYDVANDVSQKVMYLDQLYFSILISMSASFYNFKWI